MFVSKHIYFIFASVIVNDTACHISTISNFINTILKIKIMSEMETKIQDEQIAQENVNISKSLDDKKERKPEKKILFGEKSKKSAKEELVEATKIYPEHLINLVLIIKNNAEIRRFTSIGILNYLLQKGEISGPNRYVSYKWNKFSVRYNGLIREYLYTEPFFINCLVASFTSFSAVAQKTINAFCRKELGNGSKDYINKDEVTAIVESNDTHCNEKVKEEN